MALRYQEAEEISPAQDKRTVPLCSPVFPCVVKKERDLIPLPVLLVLGFAYSKLTHSTGPSFGP